MNKQNKQSDLKVKKVLTSVLAILFIALSVYLAIESATSSAEMNHLTEMQESLFREKENLTGKLIELSSLNQLETRAEKLGFTKPQKVVYINKSEEVAAKLP